MKHCSLYASVQERRIGPLYVREAPSTRGIVWSWYSDLLVYDRAKHIIEASVSGCSFRPVAFFDGVAPPPEPLWEMLTTGFAGFAAISSGVDARTRCDECGIYSYTVTAPFAKLVDMAKWDGSDIFTIWPFPRIQICTEKGAAVFRRGDIDGIAAIPIEEFDLVDGSAAPGLPSAWLDERAVRRLMADPDYMTAIWPW